MSEWDDEDEDKSLYEKFMIFLGEWWLSILVFLGTLFLLDVAGC